MPRKIPGNSSNKGFRPAQKRTIAVRLALSTLVTLSVVGANTLPAWAAPPPTYVTTYANDNGRSGVNNNEAVLYPPGGTKPTTIPAGAPASYGLVSATTFGKLFTQVLDGPSYGQPLYYQGLTLTNPYTNVKQTKNVVFVTTNNNSVYAFDADTNAGSSGGPLWKVNFNIAQVQGTPTNGNDITDIFGLPQGDVTPLVGIVGTPVIDQVSKTLFVVVRTTEGTNYLHRLHAIDITTGLEKFYSPQLVGQNEDIYGTITPAQVPGSGDDFDGKGNVYFNLLNQNQRPALTLAGGKVYVSYGGFDNAPPYHGWVFAYDAATFNPVGIFNTSPNGSSTYSIGAPAANAAIDMSGSGPAADNTGLYFTTSAGIFNANQAGTEYGESVLKLQLTSSSPNTTLPYYPPLTVQNSFTPYNNAFLTRNSIDLGYGGVSFLPDNVLAGHTHAMVVAGGEGRIYLLDRDTLGGFNKFSDSGAIQTLNGTLGPVYGPPAVYTAVDPVNQSQTTSIYFHATGDVLRAFPIAGAAPFLSTDSALASTITYDFPGARPVISSNSGKNGVVWELEGRKTSYPDPSKKNAIQNQRPFAVLHAYDAATLTSLYDSSATGGGADSIGDYIKYTAPTVANGKVYVTAGIPTVFDPGNTTAPTGTGGRLVVYGPQTSIKPTQAYHYQLSGPVGWCATSTTQTPLTGPQPVYPSPQGLLAGVVPSLAVININRPNYFSITAVDSNNKPANVKTTAHVTLISAGGSTVGQTYSLGNITFNNQSNVIATFAPSVSGYFYVKVTDANGNTSQNNPNFPAGQGYYPPYGGAGYSDQPLIFVQTAPVAGFDHFAIRTPPAVKSGVPANISITPVNAKGIPVSGYNASSVMIFDTLPAGVQSFSLPADQNPLDGVGPTNSLTDEPNGTIHALNPATQKPDTSPNGFAYEFQYGICDFAIVQGANIGINDIPYPLGYGNSNGAPYGTLYPNVFNSGTYPCVFNGVGQHVIIVEDFSSFVMTTVVVNVIQ